MRRVSGDKIDSLVFSVIDVIGFLTDSIVPRNYWATLKKREPQLLTNCQQLKMLSTDGRNRLTDCANTEGVLRIVMSVPSPKAEPLKLWLAQVGGRSERNNRHFFKKKTINLKITTSISVCCF